MDKAAKRFKFSLTELDKDVTRLQQWLETQHHLPKILDAHTLRIFLIRNKCSIEVAKQKIDNYFSVRAKMPEIYVANKINPKFAPLKEFNDIAYVVEHFQVTDDMCKLTFFQVKDEKQVDICDPMDLIRKLCIIFEVGLRSDVWYGYILVFNCKGLPSSVALRHTPIILRHILLLSEKVGSIHIKAIHIINTKSTIGKILNVVKCLIKPKVFERIHIHSTQDELKKFIPLNLLPVDFGGEGLSLQKLEDAFESKCGKYQELFDCLDEMRVDEAQRPQKLQSNETVGFYGSFKQLEVD